MKYVKQYQKDNHKVNEKNLVVRYIVMECGNTFYIINNFVAYSTRTDVTIYSHTKHSSKLVYI